MRPNMPEDIKQALKVREQEVLSDFTRKFKEFASSLILEDTTLSHIDIALGVNKVELVKTAMLRVINLLEVTINDR